MIIPVILCGGSGTRLWPLSRKSYPKQFSPLLGEESFFQASARRLSGPGFAAPVVLTASDFRFIVTEQLIAAGVDPDAVLIEPEARNTGPAILAAALYAHDKNPQAILLVAPSDHSIPDTAEFKAAVQASLPALEDGKLVTFGIAPTHAETAYGYLELSQPPGSSPAPIPLNRFVEKPDAEHAAKMIAAGNYMWNAGIFLFRAADIIECFKTHAPALMAPVRASVTNAQPDLGFLRLAPGPFAEAEDISIDYAVMEKADNLAVMPYSGAWSDLGSWDAIWRESKPDAQGVVTTGEATAIDCTDTLLRSDSDRLELVGIGLKNIMAVAMNDAVLVADMSCAQDVKRAVTILKEKNAPQATQFPKVHRPWGWFENLVAGPRFQVKRITVLPGAMLSLQSHIHRSEHWVVVEGTAKVTVENKIDLVTENQSVYIPLGSRHRMENPGKVPMVLIEVQTGAYVGEDDIQRYEDIYARIENAAE